MMKSFDYLAEILAPQFELEDGILEFVNFVQSNGPTPWLFFRLT